MRRSLCCAIVLLGAVVLASGEEVARGALVYSDFVNGDASGNYLNPTPIALAAGVNSMIFTTGFDDLGNFDAEYIRISVPAGGRITAINLPSYQDGNLSFMGFQAGSTLTFNPEVEDVACIFDCVGFGHFGEANIGTNLFPALQDFTIDNGGAGFTTPLAAPQYAFWLQETATKSTYQLDFVVEIPEPATGALMLLAASVGLIATVRHRSAERRREGAGCRQSAVHGCSN